MNPININRLAGALSLILLSSAQSAIVVTLSPAGNDTMFEIEQISDNPRISLNNVTTGVVAGILLPSESLFQESGILNESDNFRANTRVSNGCLY